MPLSEHEQRILDEIERRLAAEDPKFARSTAVATPRGVALRRMKRASLGLALGLGLLIVALVAGLDQSKLVIPVGLAAFGVMLVSVIAIAQASKDVGRIPARRANGTSWFTRQEERWRKRFERGDER